MRRDDRNDTGKRRRSFFGRLIVGLLTLLAWIGVLAMGASVLCSYVDPEKFVWISFFGLAFWEILLYNVVILVLLLLFWSRKAWVCVLALLIAIPGILRSLSFGKAQHEEGIRVMTYNVMNFRDQFEDDKKAADVMYGIASMVREYQPDVLCLQEFQIFMPKTSRADCVKLFGELAELPYHYYHNKANFGGNLIFSRYPVSPISDTTDFGKENDYGAVAQIDAGRHGKFLVVCSHLVSFNLTKTELTMFSDLGNTKNEVQEHGKTVLGKLKAAYQKRSGQVKNLLADIPHDGRPIIFCGDFNDTPLSFTYHQIKQSGFTDGFVVAGKGIGHTYAGKLPLLRIDYIWCNDQVQPLNFKRLRFKGSDHYPVMLDFKLSHGL